ncbi:hypothetical protein T12_12538 [Trichinella patagoniensis]|uniref:Uncharacterized protein n=1 Tax=Trichinella patagoniensis TaxID=990121 RepID=A0A0V0YPT5_9BILA|nr:hypothetical protein T12_12538 [Trichinella patagoniensis]
MCNVTVKDQPGNAEHERIRLLTILIKLKKPFDQL